MDYVLMGREGAGRLLNVNAFRIEGRGGVAKKRPGAEVQVGGGEGKKERVYQTRLVFER